MVAVTTATLDRTLVCEAVLKRRIWGGRRLEMMGKKLPVGEKIGESWEVADIEEGASSIVNLDAGPLSLSDAMRFFGEQIAPKTVDGRYPLLVKLLDVHQNTSIQVHPDAETCRRFFPGEKPKTESWVVIHADPGATILHDLKPGCSHAEFAWRARNGSVRECLREVLVEPGSVIHVPASTVHALQAGVMVFEVQQPSDSTFRIDDQGRTDESGRPRELHIEEAIQATKVADDRPALIWPDVERYDWGAYELLIDCGAYRLSRVTIDGCMSWGVGPDRCFTATVVTGTVDIRSRGWSGRLHRGTTVLVPSDIGEISIQPRCPATILIAEPEGSGSVSAATEEPQ